MEGITEISGYEHMGGAENLRQLVNRFYDYMESLPEAKTIRDLHPDDLHSTREKLFMFLSGWLGGPDRYISAFGHPRLRARHMPFPIGPTERDQWLFCMQNALQDMPFINEEFRLQLMNAFTQTANHMMNTKQPE